MNHTRARGHKIVAACGAKSAKGANNHSMRVSGRAAPAVRVIAQSIRAEKNL